MSERFGILGDWFARRAETNDSSLELTLTTAIVNKDHELVHNLVMGALQDPMAFPDRVMKRFAKRTADEVDLMYGTPTNPLGVWGNEQEQKRVERLRAIAAFLKRVAADSKKYSDAIQTRAEALSIGGRLFTAES